MVKIGDDDFDRRFKAAKSNLANVWAHMNECMVDMELEEIKDMFVLALHLSLIEGGAELNKIPDVDKVLDIEATKLGADMIWIYSLLSPQIAAKIEDGQLKLSLQKSPSAG